MIEGRVESATETKAIIRLEAIASIGWRPSLVITYISLEASLSLSLMHGAAKRSASLVAKRQRQLS